MNRNMVYLTRKFIHVLKNTPPVHIQNKLMGCKDREIAVAMLHMTDDEREYVFSLIAGSKGMRIKEEIRLLKRKNVSDTIKREIFMRLIRGIEGTSKNKEDRRSYFRPRKNRK